MIRNYLVITLRNFLRNQNYTLINILGLSIGITSCIVIFLLITYDLSFDKFHSQYDRLYRVVHDSRNASGVDHSGVVPYPFTRAFRNDFPDIPLVTHFHDQAEVLVAVGEEKQRVQGVLFADSLFFDVFDFEVLSGNPKKDLSEPNKVFLSESMAGKLLKGKTSGSFKINNLVTVEVAGIIKDIPPTSHLEFTMIVSMPTLTDDLVGLPLDQWGVNSGGLAYLVLPESVTKENVETRFKDFVKKYYTKNKDQEETYHLQPLSEVHFDKDYETTRSQLPTVDRSGLVVLALVGVFILVIACINFVNLATALAVKKSKEIGIRKTLGARRSQLSLYFLSETFMLTLVALLISLCVVEWTLSWLNGFVDKQLDLNILSNPMLVGFLAMLVLVVSVFSGLYPAFILSGFDPAAVLKNKITGQSSSGASVRKFLVVFQFLIAQILIIGTLVVADQMDYFRRKPLGFDKDAVVNVELPVNKPELMSAFKSRLEGNADILQVSFSLGAPSSYNDVHTHFYLTEKGAHESFDMSLKLADIHYKETYGLTLKFGRWIEESEEKMATLSKMEDHQFSFVVNEAAARTLGFNNPSEIIGKKITIGLNDINAPIVGVIADFHTSSFHSKIPPVVIMNFPYFYYDAGIKINPGRVPETVKFIEEAWRSVYPEYDFQYKFLDDHMAGLYRQEERTFTLFKIFSALSIFIGCLGLYGLISFMANQKLKEVGIRKVLGASVLSIVVLFSKEFARLIAFAFIIAAPLAWYGMNEWLQGFAYRIPIHWSVFVIGMVATLLIALLTVSYRSVKAAVTNPADTLRTE